MKISKKKVLMGATSLASIGAYQSTASADTDRSSIYDTAFVRATSGYHGIAGGEGEVIRAKNANGNERLVEDTNSLLNAAVAQNEGIVRQSDATLTDNQQIETYKSELEELQPLINEYKGLRDQLVQQKITAQRLGSNSITLNDDEEIYEIDVTDPNLLASELRQRLEDIRAVVSSNTDAINRVKNTSSTIMGEKQLQTFVKDANKLLENAQTADLHTDDGVYGSMDKVKRKAEDSRVEGVVVSNKPVVDNHGQATGDVKTTNKKGVEVNTSKTEAINIITTHTDVRETAVSSISDAIRERDRILAEIRQASSALGQNALTAGGYRDRAIENIDYVNGWLQSEQTRADNIQTEINKNVTALNTMTEYKTKYINALTAQKDKVMASTKSAGYKAKISERIDAAIAELNKSDVTMNLTETINVAENIDFGDIGREKSVIEGIATTASDTITTKVNQRLETLKQSNSAANAKITPVISKNSEDIDKFIEKLNNNGGGSQIDEAWLRTRSIYNSSPAYQTFIKKAIEQTETDSAFSSENSYGNVTIKQVADNTATATVSAAEYKAQSSHDLSNGFGSVMVPSANINDFAKVVGRKLANSQEFNGGASGILDVIDGRFYGLRPNDAPGGSEGIAVIGDIRTQHIGLVGNENVLLVVSEKPEATFKLADSFVYVNENGEHKTTDTSVKLTITNNAGGEVQPLVWPNGLSFPPLYFFYMSVDPNTGQLITGGGYMLSTPNLGTGGTGQGQGGETGNPLKLGSEDAGIDDTRTALDSRYYALPTGGDVANHPASNQGVLLNFDVKVNPVAGEWAKFSPLYISDIDDGQKLYVTKGQELDVIVGSGDVSVNDRGNDVEISTSNLGSNNGAKGNVNIDSQSVIVFGKDSYSGGLTNFSAAIGRGGNYGSIDVGLFAPFGVVGMPDVKVVPVTATVDTFDMKDPNAIAHTEGKYQSNRTIERLKADREPRGNAQVNIKSLAVNLPRAVMTKPEDKYVASSNSFIVRKLKDETRTTASGNSFVIRTVNDYRTTASGNSFVIRTANDYRTTASGNSFVIRTLNDYRTTASGNSMTVYTLAQRLGKSEVSHVAQTPTTVQQAVTIYIDPSISMVTQRALSDWQTALSKQGVSLTVTTQPTLNADLLILDADNETTRLDFMANSKNVKNDANFEMSRLAGLSLTTNVLRLTDADSDDKYNRSGSIREGQALGHSKYIVQLNSEAVNSPLQQIKVLKHEIGHLFGLDHDNEDTLMTTYYSDPIFTGVISEKSARLAAEYIKAKRF